MSCHTKVKEPSLPYYLLIEGEIVEFIAFPRLLALCDNAYNLVQVAESTSYDDNRYTMRASINIDTDHLNNFIDGCRYLHEGQIKSACSFLKLFGFDRSFDRTVYKNQSII